ncbi:MAG TPA: hypothetical protein PLH79_01285 [bacterium]|nr:hypothetical protein [bacterium]
MVHKTSRFLIPLHHGLLCPLLFLSGLSLAAWAAPDPEPPAGKSPQAYEQRQTLDDLDYWLRNMLLSHRYSWEEAAGVTGLSIKEIQDAAQRAGIDFETASYPFPANRTGVLPYPGGRHPRIGFLEGAINPRRATKASVFLPWDTQSYVVIDLPEAIFHGEDLIFLAHTHIPTVWDKQNLTLLWNDWFRKPDGGLEGEWRLPDGVEFGASIQPGTAGVEMGLWLRNGTEQTLCGLRAQVCVMLKGAAGFTEQTNANKRFEAPVAAVRSGLGNRWILTAWSPCGRVWGNAEVPCFHADPVFPDCSPGETVRARGRLWFYEGTGIESEIERAKVWFTPSPENGEPRDPHR